MKNIALILLLFPCAYASAQFVIEKKELPDTAYTIPMFNASYAYQWSAAEMHDRFGPNSNVGASITVKTKKGWYYGIKGNFLWGARVNDPKVLRNILISDGYSVIDNQGRLTHVYLGQRGSSFFALGGKMFNVLAPNKNSGILTYAGFGMLQHKISIKFEDDVASLTDEHKKGYDRFSVGPAANAFVGYLFLSKNRMINFFGGFDYTIGWTKSLRKFNYDTQEVDTDRHTNILYGIRAGWIIRLNRRQAQEFYYN
ncbi:MAG: hypothetical protein KDD41_10005 [Flavobacteriales bacterium]|nr:hypothetical protein [Flavobacteriales bacterium]